jgi:hypothetical protein
MEKKKYTTPELKSRKIDLGVFGSYGDSANGGGDKNIPIPVDIVRNLGLHME